MSEINKLLDSLQKSPGMRIMHFCADKKHITPIKDFCKEESSFCEYLIVTFTEEDAKKLTSHKNSYCKVNYLSPKRPRFNMNAKLYDYLFVETIPEERTLFFKKIYYALKNAALLFILLDKEQKSLSMEIESELIDCNYVAVNKIEIDSLLIVSAKKMHGWSGA